MATEGTFVQPAVPKFDGHYDHWAMLMENFLRSKEYWGLVENGIPAAAEGATDAQKKNIEEQKLKDLKAKNYLFQALDRTILETILNKDTAQSIWDSMKRKFHGTTRVKRAQLQALRKEFETLQMKAGESVNEYIARTLIIVNKMKASALKSLRIQVSCPLMNCKAACLCVHEQRMGSQDEEEHALKVSSGDRSGGQVRSHASYRGRGRGRGISKGRQGFDKATIECYRCHKLGHFQWECSSVEANYAETQEEMLLMAFVDTEKVKREDTWFLDSGCSNHMCGKKEYFLDFDENFVDTVKLGNNTSMAVTGKGNISLQEKGLAILFQNDRCKVYHPERGLIMDTKMSSNQMFRLHAVTHLVMQTCFNATTEERTQMWHCRYGHLSYKGLKTLQEKSMVSGLPELKSPSKLCDDCMVGKQHRASFPKKSNWRATQILHMLSSRKMPKTFWPEAVNWTVHVLNRSPTLAVKDRTPEKAWSGDKPSDTKYEKEFECDLDWNDDENRVETELEEVEGESEFDVDVGEESSSDPLSGDATLSSDRGRSRRQPGWMNDYVSREGLSEEDKKLICSEDQLDDVMTKPLKLEQFLKLRKYLGVCSIADIN
ncbi:hypothetical protein HRI_002102400 [Hibiscus trionum]|uniref:CCHC-type domain-containing protein n=1 Tax=Hibiscus trionum TaxID=183268 RepID=A0A9W7HVV4_HIBTR|nr:hypothetical protein HRI_002102400 [Hibiscus trionum]